MTIAHWGAVLATLGFSAWLPHFLHQRFGKEGAGRRFFRHPPAGIALGILTFVTATAIAAPIMSPYGPSDQPDPVNLKNLPPSLQHPLGTDVLSRDSWSRLVHGGRVTLLVGTLAMLVAVTIGSAVGALAGYFRSRVDAVLMRGVDIGLAIPRIFILLMLVAVWEHPPLEALIAIIGLTSWFGTSRLVRAEVLSLREREYVRGAEAIGAGAGHVIVRHILPNAAAPIIVSAALGIGNVMLLESGLSFLGIGVPPPMSSWGGMVADGSDMLRSAPWVSLFPGLAIALVVMALNALGDALRDAFDPRAGAA
jgi:peptide/nickel transport system permease protein